jgi:hypothetical protein
MGLDSPILGGKIGVMSQRLHFTISIKNTKELGFYPWEKAKAFRVPITGPGAPGNYGALKNFDNLMITYIISILSKFRSDPA